MIPLTKLATTLTALLFSALLGCRQTRAPTREEPARPSPVSDVRCILPTKDDLPVGFHLWEERTDKTRPSAVQKWYGKVLPRSVIPRLLYADFLKRSLMRESNHRLEPILRQEEFTVQASVHPTPGDARSAADARRSTVQAIVPTGSYSDKPLGDACWRAPEKASGNGSASIMFVRNNVFIWVGGFGKTRGNWPVECERVACRIVNRIDRASRNSR